MAIGVSGKRESSGTESKTVITSPILIVEDQINSAEILIGELNSLWDVEIHHATNFKEAKACLKKHRQNYLLAICDLYLPDAPNAEILNLMNKANVKSIAITGKEFLALSDKPPTQYMVDFIYKETFDSYGYAAGLVGRLYKNKRFKVLVVEDSNTSAVMLKTMLKLLNFNVHRAANGKQALEILEQHPDIRIVISDYEMPEMDGFQFTINARRKWDKDCLIIIGVSASGNTQLGAKFIKFGANDFLYKPYSFEELTCRIHMNVEALEHLDFIHEVANKDPLTKLHNRRYFFAAAKKIYDSSKRDNKPLWCVMIDIDFFKHINDTFGHLAGDAVLKQFSQWLASHFEGCLVARLGGEEFIVLIEAQTEIQEHLESFRVLVEKNTVNWSSEAIQITVSIGANNDHQESLETMLQIADENVYKAKSEGRNCVVLRQDRVS